MSGVQNSNALFKALNLVFVNSLKQKWIWFSVVITGFILWNPSPPGSFSHLQFSIGPMHMYAHLVAANCCNFSRITAKFLCPGWQLHIQLAFGTSRFAGCGSTTCAAWTGSLWTSTCSWLSGCGQSYYSSGFIRFTLLISELISIENKGGVKSFL